MQDGSAKAAVVIGDIGFSGHLKAVAKLGAPVILSRIGMFGIMFADIIMLGQFDSLQLAYYGLAGTIHFVLFVLGIGALSGVAVMSAQSIGAGEEFKVGTIWRVGQIHALIMGVLAIALCLPGETLLRLTGQTPEMAAAADHVLFFQAIGLPGAFVFIAGSMVLESMRRPGGVFATMIIANCANVGLNWLLIAGHSGFPGMGAAGAALSTSITRVVMALVIVLWIIVKIDRRKYNLFGPMTAPWTLGKKIRGLGYALGIAQGLESAAFASMMIFAAWIGASEAATWVISVNIISFIFMAAIGVSMATIVGVGEATGAGSSTNAARAGWSGAIIVFAVMAVAGLVLWLFPDTIASFYSDDDKVILLAIPCLLIAAFNLPGDGLQAVLMGAVRGTGDKWVPTLLHMAAFVGVMVPAALLFAFIFDFGLPGLMMGITAGTYSASLMLGWRFHKLCKHGINRL
jgi:MATE family multidrug resistance protein